MEVKEVKKMSKKTWILGFLFLSLFFLVQQGQNVQEVEGQQQQPVDGFVANGIVSSDIITATSVWTNTGNWSMVVNDNELQNFVTNMIWTNQTSGHTHEFTGFEAEDGEIVLPPDKILSIRGTMDVGTNRVVTWEDVPTVIDIGGGGQVISISLDHEATDHHFAGQAVRGTVNQITACSDTPGASMEVAPRCPGAPTSTGPEPAAADDDDEEEEEDEDDEDTPT
jgi:hypothetical protein